MSMWHHVTLISPDTLLQLESMCILCVLAGIWPHTFTTRYGYLMWNMICWTELYGSALTKAIDLSFWHISLVNDRVPCVSSWMGWLWYLPSIDQLSHSQYSSIYHCAGLNTFPLGLFGALPHVQTQRVIVKT